MAKFLNNKYGYANFVGLMMIIFAGFFNIPVYLKMFMLAVGFGLFLGPIIITIVTIFKRYNEEKKKAEQPEK